MPSANGHSPKRAILYARVSTDEQAGSGYSLAQQLEALRDYASRESYEVLEEVIDPGQSGASLERPGMDRVRDLVVAGGVSMVLAQDRDRIAREPAYHYLLRKEFEEHGTKIRALNDRGDDSPEGELTDGILDQLAKYERAKIAERSRRGKLRKAREGKVLRGPKPPYGFRYDAEGEGLLVHEAEMALIERIFRMAAEGASPQAILARLYEDGVPSPRGDRTWVRRTLEQILRSDLYRAHTREELAGLLSPEVLARLDECTGYGIWWFGRKNVRQRQVSEPDGNGGRRYRKATTTRIRSVEERTAVPVPAYLPRELVDQARMALAERRPPERKRLARRWELRGLMRCSCGWKMTTHRYTEGQRRRVPLLRLQAAPRAPAGVRLYAEVCQGGRGRAGGVGTRLRPPDGTCADTERHGAPDRAGAGYPSWRPGAGGGGLGAEDRRMQQAALCLPGPAGRRVDDLGGTWGEA